VLPFLLSDVLRVAMLLFVPALSLGAVWWLFD
jgi:C4-dicarboxylate transporter DctM subunit